MGSMQSLLPVYAAVHTLRLPLGLLLLGHVPLNISFDMSIFNVLLLMQAQQVTPEDVKAHQEDALALQALYKAAGKYTGAVQGGRQAHRGARRGFWEGTGAYMHRHARTYACARTCTPLHIHHSEGMYICRAAQGWSRACSAVAPCAFLWLCKRCAGACALHLDWPYAAPPPTHAHLHSQTQTFRLWIRFVHVRGCAWYLLCV